MLTGNLRRVKDPEPWITTARRAFKNHWSKPCLTQVGNGGPERAMMCQRSHGKSPTVRTHTLVGPFLVLWFMGKKKLCLLFHSCRSQEAPWVRVEELTDPDGGHQRNRRNGPHLPKTSNYYRKEEIPVGNGSQREPASI